MEGLESGKMKERATFFQYRDGRAIDCLSVVVETEHLKLVPTLEAHAPAIFENFTEQIATYMNPRPARKMAETLEFIRSSRESMAKGTNLQLTILNRVTEQFIGCCGLHGQPSSRIAELGIWVAEVAHGNGYGLEAIVGLNEWAEREIEYDYLVYPVSRENFPSRRIPEVMGGVMVGEKPHLTPDGRTLNQVTYWLYPRKSCIKSQ